MGDRTNWCRGFRDRAMLDVLAEEMKSKMVEFTPQDCECLKDKKIGEQALKFIHQATFVTVRSGLFVLRPAKVTSFLYKCPATALRAEQRSHFRFDRSLVLKRLRDENLGLWGIRATLVRCLECTNTLKSPSDVLEVLAACSKVGDWSLARLFFQKVKARFSDAVIGNACMSTCSSLSAWQTSLEVLSQMTWVQMENDVISLTVPQFREFLSCGYGTPPALLALMQMMYLHFNLYLILCDLQVEWCKVYDVDYIEQDVIGKLQSFRDQLKSVVDEARRDFAREDQNEEEARVRQRAAEMQLSRESAMEAYESSIRRKHILAEHQREDSGSSNGMFNFSAMKVVEGYPTERREGDLEILLRRAHGMISHDLCHFFGMSNCQFYICRMQGSSGLHESDTNQDKVDLCPVCLRKLSWNLACGSHEGSPSDLTAWCVQRYRRLLAHAEKLGPVLHAYKEMERKRDLIRQIRALEKVPGLLDEMSLAELKERLRIERTLEADLSALRMRAAFATAEMLAKVRERAREEQQQRHEEQKKQKILEEQQKQIHREKCITEVAEKLQLKKRQKKEEEQRLKLELKEIATKRQFLAANAEQVEAKAHAEQQAGLDREAMKRQKVSLIEQRKKNRIKVGEERDIEEYQQLQQTVTARVERAKAADLALKEEILQSVKSARNMQRQVAKKNMAELGHSSNAYMKRIQNRMATSC
eukprot:Skav215578  [mRNA]  locus=scaffold2748:114034:142296:- [translate_table: standard]